MCLVDVGCQSLGSNKLSNQMLLKSYFFLLYLDLQECQIAVFRQIAIQVFLAMRNLKKTVIFLCAQRLSFL